MNDSTALEIVIPSVRANIAMVEPFLSGIECIRELEESRYFNLLIAVTEAVNNGIVHGNACVESKMVALHVRWNKDDIVITVRDEGKGFDPNLVPDPRRKENILKDGGRGVFLIRSLVDDCRFLFPGSGTVLEMTVHRNLHETS